MRISIATETRSGERRVAATDDSVRRLIGLGASVLVERGAGERAAIADQAYLDAGAELGERAEVLASAEVLLHVVPPDVATLDALANGATTIGFAEPSTIGERLDVAARRQLTVMAVETLPRSSRAQAVDALSSQAMVAGYRAMIEAAWRLPRMFPLSMTSAGTVPPAKVFVLGAGVAGLQAIAVARRLGALVSANDVRAAAGDEVRSLGATFVDVTDGQGQEGSGGYARAATAEELAAQRERLVEHLAGADVIITTAAVPGRPAPRLITSDMVARLRPGTVVIDMAADTGGNCELSRPGEVVDAGGVSVVGLTQVPSTMADVASKLYARNLSNLMGMLTKDGVFAPDPDDDIVAGATLIRAGVPVHPLLTEGASR
jgi:H+-translocating NAD(P) transhydrogenase subunit alpha